MAPSAPRVSVVITTHNRLAFLREAVASVLQQTLDASEVLVVDDGSSDGTAKWLEDLEQPRLRWFRNDRVVERSAARNRGLEHAAGEFVLFLDDDDRLRPQALEILVEALGRHPEAVAAVGARWKFGEQRAGSRIIHPAREQVRRPWPELLAGTGWSMISGQTLQRARPLRGAGGYRGELIRSEDRELWLRLIHRGSFVLIPDIVLEHRTHPGQTTFPPNIDAIREQIYADAIAALPERDRRYGRRCREAGRCWDGANRARESGSFGRALLCYLRAAVTAPTLAASPLMRPALAHGLRSAVTRRRE
jgi:glycosyltransferase involved in cell wall biosynthesis